MNYDVIKSISLFPQQAGIQSTNPPEVIANARAEFALATMKEQARKVSKLALLSVKNIKTIN